LPGILTFLENNASAIATVGTAVVAWLVYKKAKRDEKRDAANIILMDVRQAEKIVHGLLEKQDVDHNMGKIILENNWSKYKHLFVSEFSQDDFEAFNRFFDSCIQINEARDRMLKLFEAGLSQKAVIAQQRILDEDKNPEDKKKSIDALNKEAYVFVPNEPKEVVFRSLSLMGRLSITCAFEKLKKIAGIKN